ncbi:MAG: type VI secretion system Vgr family protein [Janthinobacterium lividum]
MALPQIQIGDGMLGDALLSSVDVIQELNRHWWCTVVCRNTEDARIPVEDLLGKPVEVKTTDDDGVERVHFAGSVHDVRLDYEVWGSYTATLTAVSDSFGMDVTAHKQYYSEGTLSSLAATIAGRHGLSVAVKAADDKALNYVQYGESDWSFLGRIVDDHGAWMRPCEKGVEVFDSFQSGSTVQWRGEGDLIAFSLQGRRVNPSFSGSHYDHHAMESKTFSQLNKAPQFYPAAQQLTGSVQAASQQLPPGFEPQRARAMTLANYSDQLEAESERSLGSAVTGTGSSRNQTLMAGNTVTLEGTIDAKGTYGLTRVLHRWTSQGYSNDFNCTPWKQYRNPESPVARTWSGIVSARVTAHNDPKKMGRIQVQFFWQEDGSTHWARATSPHAGPDRGFMFMPEVGDEVAVAFEDGDPERPVILGSVWNGLQQAPRNEFWGEDIADNNIKRMLTKSGNRMQFVDTPGKESVVVATPSKLRFSMIENTNEHGRSTITLHSEDGDILLSAPNGQVHIRSKNFTKETNS